VERFSCPLVRSIFRGADHRELDVGELARKRDQDLGAKKGKPLVAQGRQLADQNESELGVVVVGSELETLVKGLETTGPDHIFFVDEPELRHYNPEIYVNVTCQVLEKVLNS
jgi:electron transfer flavoprotein alpha subunit